MSFKIALILLISEIKPENAGLPLIISILPFIYYPICNAIWKSASHSDLISGLLTMQSELK